MQLSNPVEQPEQRPIRLAGLLALAIAAVACALLSGSPGSPTVAASPSGHATYIVRATTIEAAEALVLEAGGRLTARLGIIDAVGARLDASQLAALRAGGGTLGIYADTELEVQGDAGATHYPVQVGADQLHRQGLTGRGVTIAVLDTGLWQTPPILNRSDGQDRIRATFDATLAGFWNWNDDDCDDDDCESGDLDDWNGHGTHVASIIASSTKSAGGLFQGIAPDARLVAVRAFEPDGSGRYIDVIKALDWIVRNRNRYDIDVLNLSFGAPAASHYWDDPVNLAVMVAWRSGITVVASAGNRGPGPMTVGVPGNVPYVITVGAYTDSYSPADDTDDRLASFSAAGPTVEGFVKPDVVAPGGHMLGLMPPYAWLPLQYPEYVRQVGESFAMSGTSQAAAVVSGVIALMLEADPSLEPDDIKCRLMISARAALRPDGTHAYSVFQQGAGKVYAPGAVAATELGCANQGLDIRSDLDGSRHFAGPAGVDPDGNYYLVDHLGERRSGSAYEWIQGALWPEGAAWSDTQLWSHGALWGESIASDDAVTLNPDSLLTQGSLWPEGALWPQGLQRKVATYLWVDQE